MRCDGPVPCTWERSIPFSSAIFRASGLAKTRPVELAAPLLCSAGKGAMTGVDDGAGAAFGSGDGLAGDGCAAEAGVASLVCPAASSTLSSSSASTMISLPISTDSPSAMRILATVPSSKDCSSIVALSVSMSASASPVSTVSPGLTFHLRTVPDSIVSDKRGMVISIGIGKTSLVQPIVFITAATIRSLLGRYSSSNPLA